MNLTNLVKGANTVADENYSIAELLPFFNDAVAKINIEADANFPSFENNGNYEHPLPEKWQISLLVPFVVGRIKQQDSSQFEYTDAYREFTQNFQTFLVKYEIPDQYKELGVATSYDFDVSESPFAWNGGKKKDSPLD